MGLKYSILEYPVGPPMLNLADLLSSAGSDCPSVMVETAVPFPAAQSCPARCDPAGKVAEHDCHPGMFCMPLMVVCDCDVTVTLIRVAEMYPLLSSAITSSTC